MTRLTRTYRILPLLLFALYLPFTVAAAPAVKNASLTFSPPRPFVGQPFTVTIEVSVTPGVELEQVELNGLPDSSRATFTNLSRAGRRQQRGSSEALDILRYTLNGRGIVDFAGPFSCTIRAMAVERVSGGFFSHTRSFPVALRTSTANLEIRPLPAHGRPTNFSGAVGRFSLTATATPLTVAPGDIITLTCTLNGNGWLADATLSPTHPETDFKTYPPQILERQESPPLISLSQAIIPLSTNVTAITPPVFNYFDPHTATYRNTTAPPIPIAFSTVATTEPAIRRITATPANPPPVATAQPDIVVSDAVAKLRQMLPLTLAFLAAVTLCAAIYRFHRLIAWLCAIAILAVGIFISHRLSQTTTTKLLNISTTTTCYLTPSQRSLPLFELYPDDTATPLEHIPGWFRVRVAGNEAWLQEAAISTP